MLVSAGQRKEGLEIFTEVFHSDYSVLNSTNVYEVPTCQDSKVYPGEDTK